jgi:hypothetical protein
VEALTPASADVLPPLGELIADDPFWRHPAGGPAWEGVAHLRVWTTPTDPPGHLAVVTETGSAASVTEFAGHISADLARAYGRPLVLLEHYPAPEAGEGVETLDLVRIGADGSPHWLRVWPTPQENPRHAGLELWMAIHGYRIVSQPATWFDRRLSLTPERAITLGVSILLRRSSLETASCGVGRCSFASGTNFSVIFRGWMPWSIA